MTGKQIRYFMKNTDKKDINATIKSVSNYEEFLLLLKPKGYETKLEKLEENTVKYISFHLLNKERFVRGNTRSLRKEYTKELIINHIEEKTNLKSILKMKTRISDRSINTSGERFQNSLGLKKWG